MAAITASPAAVPSEPPMKVEVLHRGNDRIAVELADARIDRVAEPGLAAGVLEAVGVAALVAEFQRVDAAPRANAAPRTSPSSNSAFSRAGAACACG